MTFPRQILALLLLFLPLSGTVAAQDLYVSNRPFKGEVVKSGNGMQVELEPLLKALKLDLKAEGGQVKIGDKTVTVTQSASGKGMVSLPEFAAAAGLTVRKNADFGHTDVYASTSAPTGDWGADTAASSSGPGAAQGGADYTIKVPPDYELINDPDMMAAIVGMVGKRSDSKLPDGALGFEFLLTPKQGTTRKGVLMLMTINLPGPVPAEEEASFVKAVTEGMQKKGQLVNGPTKTSVGGLNFYKSLIKTTEDGETNMMETHLHLAAALGKVYCLALVDEEASYSTSFPSLRNIVGTFRLK